ncbi:MAG: carbohydrate porin [Candidatus Thiodiazotropha sp.]
MNKSMLLLLLVVAGASVANAAQSGTDSWLDGDTLTGDWNGRRTALEAEGYHFFAYFNSIVARNVSGGLESSTAGAGDLYAGMQVDLGKALDWNGWTFNLSGINRNGRSIDEEVGGIYSVMQLVGGQTHFLYGLNLEKSWDNDKYALKFGRTTATDDFAGSPFYGYYLSNSIDGQIRAVLFDGVMTSYPFAIWGARFKYAPSDGFRLKIGAYQLTEKMWDPQEHGTDFAFRSSDGVSLMTQLEWDWSNEGRPGHFNFGMNNVRFDMPNFNSTDVTENFMRYYFQMDQQITSESPGSDQGLYLFGTLAYTAQHEAALVPLQVSLGAQYVGPFEGRNADRLIFGTTYGKLSDEYADEQVALGHSRPDNELIVELGYRAQVTKFAYIQPDIQYVRKPGGTGEIPNATVLGVQFGVSF